MHQAPVTPVRECSILKASEPGKISEQVRSISLQEQEEIQQKPFFDSLSAFLNSLAQAIHAKHAKRETPQPPPLTR